MVVSKICHYSPVNTIVDSVSKQNNYRAPHFGTDGVITVLVRIKPYHKILKEMFKKKKVQPYQLSAAIFSVHKKTPTNSE